MSIQIDTDTVLGAALKIFAPSAVVEVREPDPSSLGEVSTTSLERTIKRLRIKTAGLGREAIRNPVDSSMRAVFSFSGIRFYAGEGPGISEELKVLTATTAYTEMVEHCRRWREFDPNKKELNKLIGRETRPTALILTEIQTAAWMMAARDEGFELTIENVGQVTSPSFQEYIRATGKDGGVIVTASHCPRGDDGFKFCTGLKEPELESINQNGGLLSLPKKEKVIEGSFTLLKQIADGNDAFIDSFNNFVETNAAPISATWENSRVASNRRKLKKAYREYIKTVYRRNSGKNFLNGEGPACIVMDAGNGGASRFYPSILKSLGVQVRVIHDVPGKHRRRIEPIDEALLPGKQKMLETGAQMAYFVDGDADRLTLVLLMPDGRPYQPSPQEVAALNVGCIYSYLETHRDRYPEFFAEGVNKKRYLPLHDAASGRVAEVGRAFGYEAIYANVGEMNLVTLANAIMNDGGMAPILSESYNAGTVITLENGQIRAGLVAGLGVLLVSRDLKAINHFRAKMGFSPVATPHVASILEALPKYTSLHNFHEVPLDSSSPEEIINKIEQCKIASLLGKQSSQEEELKGGYEKFPYPGYTLRPKRAKGFVIDGIDELVTHITVHKFGGVRIGLHMNHSSEVISWCRFSVTQGGSTGLLRTLSDSKKSSYANHIDLVQRQCLQEVGIKLNSDQTYLQRG